jgi:hypothetical protein
MLYIHCYRLLKNLLNDLVRYHVHLTQLYYSHKFYICVCSLHGVGIDFLFSLLQEYS